MEPRPNETPVRSPIIDGSLIHAAVAIEAALALRLLRDLGIDASFFSHVILAAFIIIVMGAFYWACAKRVGMFFGKKAGFTKTFLGLQSGLTPFLLLLPLALLFRASGAPASLYIVVGLLLLSRVLDHWRSTIKSVFRMNQFQSTLTMTVASFAALSGGITLIYLTVLSRTLAFL